MVNDPEHVTTPETPRHPIADRYGGAGPGLAVLGCLIVGALGVVQAVIMSFISHAADELSLVGAGLSLIASGLAFGLLANALCRSKL